MKAFDQLIQVLGLLVNGVPGSLGVVPQGVELLDVPGLLFHPGVVLEVVDPLAVHIGQLHHAVGLEAQHVEDCGPEQPRGHCKRRTAH